MPWPESGFLCCVPKGKELLLANREKSFAQQPSWAAGRTWKRLYKSTDRAFAEHWFSLQVDLYGFVVLLDAEG